MREIHHLDDLIPLLASGAPLLDTVLRGLDLRADGAALAGRDLRGLVLLGCNLTPTDLVGVIGAGALVFPPITGLPYEPWRTSLYSPEELFYKISLLPHIIPFFNLEPSTSHISEC